MASNLTPLQAQHQLVEVEVVRVLRFTYTTATTADHQSVEEEVGYFYYDLHTTFYPNYHYCRPLKLTPLPAPSVNFATIHVVPHHQDSEDEDEDNGDDQQQLAYIIMI